MSYFVTNLYSDINWIAQLVAKSTDCIFRNEINHGAFTAQLQGLDILAVAIPIYRAVSSDPLVDTPGDSLKFTLCRKAEQNISDFLGIHV